MKKLLTFLVAIICLLGLTSCTKREDTKIIDIKISDENYAFAVAKGNYELRDDFNVYLQGIIDSGELDKIIDKYTNNGEGEKVGVTPTAGSVENDENTFVVSTNMPFEPFEYKDNNGVAYGIDIEIAIGYAESRGLEIKVIETDFDSILEQVNKGDADIGMAGLTVTKTRAENCEFTIPYFRTSQKLVVNSSNHTFDKCETAEDVYEILKGLENVKIGYQNGTTGNLFIVGDEDLSFDGFENIEGVGYAAIPLVLQDVSYGRLFAAVIDELPAEAANIANNSGFIEKVNVFLEYFTNGYYLNLLLLGLRNTALIAVLGLAIGLLLGIVIGVIKVAPKYKWYMKVLDKISSVYVTIFRGTPIVVQLLLAYFVILPLFQIMVDKLIVAIIVFGLNSSAYIAEIIRGGISSVDKGQLEASRALGLGYKISMIKVVIPQAIKNIIPSIGNEFITLIKETSVASFISVMDLYNVFKNIGNNTYDFMIPYLAMALTYIVIIIIISFFVKLIEKKFSVSERRN